MKPSFGLSLVLLPALCGWADGTDSTPSHSVAISAEIPTVAIAPQSAHRRSLDLPSLEYLFQVDARCDAGWQPESLSLNVADSRVSLSGAELNDRSGEPVLLRVPARQIAPVAIGGFCVIGSAEEGSIEDAGSKLLPPLSQLTIGGALSAQVSLVCRSGDDRRITYAARPLDVKLSCEAPAEVEPGTGAASR